MTKTISCNLAALGILAMAVCATDPAAAAVKPATLSLQSGDVVLVAKKGQQARRRGGGMNKQQQGMQKMKQYIPAEYQQMLGGMGGGGGGGGMGGAGGMGGSGMGGQ